MKSGNLLKIFSALAALLVSVNSAGQANDSLTYTEDILPLFATTCLDCHGSDESRRMMNLRLDTQDFLSSHIVPGDPSESLIFQRITHGDAVRKMPPVSSGRTLTDEQIQSVRSWIVSGAEWGTDLNAAEQAELLLVAERKVNFTREVRPILSRNCFQCHGPDDQNRQMGLRLDTPEGFGGERGAFGGPVVIPGNAQDSPMFQRVSAAAENFRMPRDRDALTSDEIETIRLWINQGAQWESHWAFVTPDKPSVPVASSDQNWPNNPIDNFVLRRLDEEGLSPSLETDRATLIRRVTLDLTGVPPTLDEIDAFLADNSPDAYEKVVDRLLQSPRFGERMAVEWLDAARYADTNGYQTDGERSMWRWRDWVINAYNNNMPFDQFTVEQLAGDMLPNATLDQRIATAFNRNHSLNAEGGIVPEEFLVEYAVDRVATTSTVWLGLTFGCARCHDHKFDPLQQREFYEFSAFFNNIDERGKGFKYVNSPPFISAPTSSQQSDLNGLDDRLVTARLAFAELEALINEEQARWEESVVGSSDIDADVDWNINEGLLAHHALDGDISGIHVGQVVEATLENGLPHFVDGRIGAAASFDGERFITAGNSPNLDYENEFTLSAWVYPTADTGVIFSRANEGDQGEVGWGLYLEDGKIRLSLSTRTLDDGVAAETIQAIQLNRWQHITATYDGSKTPGGMRVYVDGDSIELVGLLDLVGNRLPQRYPLRIGASGSSKLNFQGNLDDVRIYGRVLSSEEVAVVATAETISEIARVDSSSRSQAQSDKLRLSFLNQYAAPEIRAAYKEVKGLEQERETLRESFPTVMVMEEMSPRRSTFRLNRGVYDNPGEEVFPNTPSILPPLPGGDKNRLSFANWLVDVENPLTSRVTVNRYWQTYFGTGLVKTADNFGSQGEFPSHPELLDWLATSFIDSGWDVKEMQRLIVTSATYRQSSVVSPELVERDPENRLLARATRMRLPAQMIRDQALAISGLLTEKIGGPSVGPYQPEGLWDDIVERGQEYRQSSGEDLYRRSLYTFWKRTRPAPAMITFDSSTRETHMVSPTRTNTPLQALNLMNDVTYTEAARAMAQRVMQQSTDVDDNLTTLYRIATAREPQARVHSILTGAFEEHLQEYRSDRASALQLISEGESERDETLDIAELAAYQMVASLILNLDGTITRD
jgi:mono/diheme cytochrome c family protein